MGQSVIRKMKDMVAMEAATTTATSARDFYRGMRGKYSGRVLYSVMLTAVINEEPIVQNLAEQKQWSDFPLT